MENNQTTKQTKTKQTHIKNNNN